MRAFLLSMLGLAAGCVSDGGALASKGSEHVVGQSGSEPPAAVCNADSQCRSSLVDDVRREGAAPAEFVSTPCLQPQLASGSMGVTGSPDAGAAQHASAECRCTTASGAIFQLTAAARDECLRFGRRGLRGQCLYTRDEFPGCDLGDDASCEPPCTALRERLHEDSRPAASASLRSKRCVDGRCSVVLEVNGACFHNDSEQPFDCALTDDQIRAASHAGK